MVLPLYAAGTIANTEGKMLKDNYFTIHFTNCCCDKLLLVSEKNDINNGLRWKLVKIDYINSLSKCCKIVYSCSIT